MPNINYQLGDVEIVVTITEQANYTPCVGAVQRLPWGNDQGSVGHVLPQPPTGTPTTVLRGEIANPEHQAIVNRHRETSGENIIREVGDEYARIHWVSSQYIGELYCNHFELQLTYRR